MKFKPVIDLMSTYFLDEVSHDVADLDESLLPALLLTQEVHTEQRLNLRGVQASISKRLSALFDLSGFSTYNATENFRLRFKSKGGHIA